VGDPELLRDSLVASFDDLLSAAGA
jgi:hypothetical protein